MVTPLTKSDFFQSIEQQLSTIFSKATGTSLNSFESEFASVARQVVEDIQSAAAKKASSNVSSQPSVSGYQPEPLPSASSAETSQTSVAATFEQPAGGASTAFGSGNGLVESEMSFTPGITPSSGIYLSSASPVSAPATEVATASKLVSGVSTTSVGGDDTNSSDAPGTYDFYTNTWTGSGAPTSTSGSLTDPFTGQVVNAQAVFASYQSVFGDEQDNITADIAHRWGQAGLDLYIQQNPSAASFNWENIQPLTLFQQYGPNNAFVDPSKPGFQYFDVNGIEHEES